MVTITTFQEEQHKQMNTPGGWLPHSVRNGEGGSGSRKDIQRRGHSDNEWRGSMKAWVDFMAHMKRDLMRNGPGENMGECLRFPAWMERGQWCPLSQESLH